MNLSFTLPKTFETDANGVQKTPVREIFVSNGGSDRGDGTREKPYKTVACAFRKLAPGTALRIMPGVYNEAVNSNWKDDHKLYGTEDEPIWIGGCPGEEKPVLTHESGPFFLNKGCYVIFHDMIITGTRGGVASTMNIHAGGSFEYVSHHFVFRDLIGHDNEGCVTLKGAGVHDAWIINCDLSGKSGYIIDFVGGHNITIAGNYIHDSSGVGVKMKGGSTDSDICGNFFENTGMQAIDVGQATGYKCFNPPIIPGRTYEARGIRVSGNIFKECLAPFAFWSSTDCHFTGNTVVNPREYLFRLLPGEKDLPLANNGFPHDNTVKNNIFYYNKNRGMGDWANMVPNIPQKDKDTIIFRNNLFYNTDSPDNSLPEAKGLTYSDSISADPLFTDAANDDYSLSADSPAKGLGAVN